VITIRIAEPHEYERVGELTVAAYRSLPVDHLWGGYEASILDTATRAKHADILVAVLDEQLVGAVTYVDDPASPWREWSERDEAQFRLLGVDVAARGHGVGEHLVRACMERAGDDAKPLIIHTTRWMEAAQRMYERLGFVRRPDRDVPYAEWNDPPVDDLPAAWIAEAFLGFSWHARR
jgi:ribosomal protein S18 acetylase RimI-like enzyme